MADKVKIDKTSLDQLLQIRDSGLTNMFDFTTVQRLAYDREFYELVTWMEEHKNEYGKLIMYGSADDEE